MDAAEQFLYDMIELDGLKINCFHAGEQGSPIVLLHGGGIDSALLSWRYALPALAGEHRVFAPDWPGYGKSDPLSGPYRLERLLPVISGLLAYYMLERVSLVGLGMGGGAAIEFALAYPSRVDHLVLVDPYGLQRKKQSQFLSFLYLRLPFLLNSTWSTMRRSKGMTETALQTIFADPKGCTEDFVEEVHAVIQDANGEKSFRSFQRSEVLPHRLRTNYLDRISSIQAPTLFLHGDSDRLTPVDEIRQIAGAMPDARVMVMENTAQWPPREHPEQFQQLILDFLREAGQ